jgi:hypothetical protein
MVRATKEIDSMVSKKRLIALVLAAHIAPLASPAQAGDGLSPGAAAAVGVLGGLAIGGAIGSAAASPYYPGKPVYSPAPAPAPVYYGRPRRTYVETIEEAPACYVKRRRYVDEFGDVVIRRVRICE